MEVLELNISYFYWNWNKMAALLVLFIVLGCLSVCGPEHYDDPMAYITHTAQSNPNKSQK